MQRILIALFLLVSFNLTAISQEFACRVTINTQPISGAEFSHLTDLGPLIQEYFNRQIWTNDEFQENERLQCEIQVFIQEAIGLDHFKARTVFGVSRPIYGTAQTTQLFVYIDESWEFDYVQNQGLTRQPDSYNNFTSVLDFFAYLMLGYDYDTFSEMGGEKYFQQARQIAEFAQGSGDAGWSSLGSNSSRTILIEELADPRAVPFRKGLYQYHFQGLDHFTRRTDQARTDVLEALKGFKTVFEEMQEHKILDLFLSIKQLELVGIFKESQPAQDAYGILLEIDPTNASIYQKMVN